MKEFKDILINESKSLATGRKLNAKLDSENYDIDGLVNQLTTIDNPKDFEKVQKKLDKALKNTLEYIKTGKVV